MPTIPTGIFASFFIGWGRYEQLTSVETASGDNEVHEHVVVNGPVGHLKTEMNHYAFPNIGVFVEKHNRYSNWEARVASGSLPASERFLAPKQAGRVAAQAQGVVSKTAFPAHLKISLCLYLSEGISGRRRGLLFCAFAWNL
jgi:hypothetical protein